MTKKRRQGQKGVKGKGKIPAELSSGAAADEEEAEEDPTPKQGNASSVAEALADAPAELEVQSKITSAGKESGKELQSGGALSEVMKRRPADAQKWKEENVELKRKLEELEKQVRSSQVSKLLLQTVISKCLFE